MKTKLLNAISIAATFLVVSLSFSPSLQAQSTFSRITHVNFSGPVEIPGMILPAGDYTFELAPGIQTNVIQIRDKDNVRSIALLLTIADYRMTPTSDTVMLFRERAAGSPQALRAWFYPGENYGHEFVYPRTRAIALAAANQVNVPAVADNTPDSGLSGAHVTEVTPSGSEAEVAATAPTPTAAPEANTPSPAASNQNASNNLVASNQPLPKTASQVFLFALSGGVFVAAGFGLGLIGRRRSQEELG